MQEGRSSIVMTLHILVCTPVLYLYRLEVIGTSSVLLRIWKCSNFVVL